MVCEVSRLSRSVKEFCGILETIQQKHLRLMILGSITVDCSSHRGRFETTEKVKRKAREQTKRREDMV